MKEELIKELEHAAERIANEDRRFICPCVRSCAAMLITQLYRANAEGAAGWWAGEFSYYINPTAARTVRVFALLFAIEFIRDMSEEEIRVYLKADDVY